MSNVPKESTRARSYEQLSLLEAAPITAGRLEAIPHTLKAALVAAIRPCPLSRYQLAAQISELMGRDLTKSMLDQYTAESSEGHRIPAEVLPAFCLVTGTREPLEILASAIGCELAGPEESRELEITRLRLEKARLERRIKVLERVR